ncbi:MAG: UPF0147 family protein [Nitrososphaerales archaeon]
MVSKKQQENLAKIDKAINSLKHVADNVLAPKNVRKFVKNSISVLQDSSLSPAVRAANAISLLDEILQDQNMPNFIRVTLWQVLSILEGIKE